MNRNVQARNLSRPGAPADVQAIEPAIGKVVAVAEEQVAYANLLDLGMKVGLLGLLVTFGIYMSGVLAPHIPLHDLPKYWSMPVKKYLAATGIAPGWGWLSMLSKGDFLNFVGIAFLSAVTIVCYLAVFPVFFRKKDSIYAWLTIMEVVVLVLAASGILGGGGH
jgi:hypothetical protein